MLGTEQRIALVLVALGVKKVAELARQLVENYVFVYFLRLVIGEKRVHFLDLVLVRVEEFVVEYLSVAHGHVGRVGLTLGVNAPEKLKHVGQRRAERDNNDHILRTVFCLGIGIGENHLAVKGVTAHKAVAREEIGDLDAVALAYGEYLVSSVAHSVHNYFFVGFGKILPEVERR